MLFKITLNDLTLLVNAETNPLAIKDVAIENDCTVLPEDLDPEMLTEIEEALKKELTKN